MRTWEITYCHLKNKGESTPKWFKNDKYGVHKLSFLQCKKNNHNFKAITIILKTNNLQIQEWHQLKILFITNGPKNKINKKFVIFKDFFNNVVTHFHNYLNNLFSMELVHFKLTFIIPFHPKKLHPLI